jgi:sugar-specific transcriptional regulator TrmB
MEEFQEKLKKTGLTGNESKVYLELLKQGELSANELAKKIGMDRTLTYTVLNNLIKKGIISYVIKSNKKFFKAENPENLLNPLKEKEIFINDLIPQLKKIQQIKDIPYEINIYEGKEGLRTFLKLIIKHKALCVFGATGRVYDLLYEVQATVKNLKRKDYSARIITSPKYKNHKMMELEYIKFKFLNIKSEATTSIFGDYVSIHILTQKPLVILIKNKEISESYRSHFEVLWKIAKK